MANEIEKVNTIAIADIEKFNGKTDDNMEKINAFEFTGVVIPAWAGTRGLVMGGSSATASQNAIQYKTFASDAATTMFGDLNSARDTPKGSGGNRTRVIHAGGRHNPESGSDVHNINIIDYITVGSTGDGTDFGDLHTGQSAGGHDGASNATLLFCNGGYTGSANLNNMEYLTIASTGNGTDAGDLEQGQSNHATSHGDSKYLIMGGYTGSGSPREEVSTHTFHTSNNASDYGNVGVYAIYGAGTACATDRVVVAGGFTATSGWTAGNQMQYFPVASSADGLDFGDIHEAGKFLCGTSDGTRGEFYGGIETTSGVDIVQNTIEKITIASTGNTTDVGDMNASDYDVTGFPNENGGIYGGAAQTGT